MPKALTDWFAARYAAPTNVQEIAWRRTLRGDNTLILAPTGSGKTLAAFFSVLARLGAEAARGALPNATVAIYVTPLRALGRDILRNLEEPLAALNAGLPARQRVRAEIRTGDTAMKHRSRMTRQRPHLLLTTPESLSSLLSQKGWLDGFVPQVVIVDEIHAFAENKRGALLALSLERLAARGHGTLQRIGLSATAAPASAIAELLCGHRQCAIVQDSVRRTHRIDLHIPEALPAAGYDPGRVALAAVDALAQAQSTLAFCSTRSAAERLGAALGFLLPEDEDRIGVHHSSIERGQREAIEERLARGQMKCVVCSTSLELGVDYAGVDQVMLVGTPRGVSRALQRLGRSGHRTGQMAYGRLLPLSLPDLLEAIAMREAVRAGALEELRIPQVPLDVLAQVLLGMAVERRWEIGEALALVRRAGPYLELPEHEFREVLTYLAGGGQVLARYGKIVVEDGHFTVASSKVARDYFHGIGTISEDFRVKVVTKNNRRLGDVEEGFLASLRPGEAFLMAGKVVEIERLEPGIAIVKPSTSEQVQTPRWMGGKMPLSSRMAEEELRLRRTLRETFAAGGRAACEELLREVFRVPERVAALAAGFVERQAEAAPIPVDSPVQVERVRRGRQQVILLHCVAGRAVNQSLAWVVAWRLARGESVVSNSNDHGFLLSMGAHVPVDEARLRAALAPAGFMNDLETVLRGTDTLGRKFRNVAETGQLIPKRSYKGPANKKFSTWNGSLLYQTLLTYEPDHVLVRETVREIFEDLLDAPRALTEARRLQEAPWEWFEHPRPSPFALPLFAAFNRDVLLAGDIHRAFDEMAAAVYAEWDTKHAV